jgi:hypothetical protein
MNAPRPVPVVRALAAGVVLAASGAASAYLEIHVDEITTPARGYATARVAALEALPTRTPTERRELALLRGLSRNLDRTQFALRGDFAELRAAAATFGRLGAAGAPMQASIDEGFRRAGLSLSERTDLTQDHLDAIPDFGIPAKHKKAVQAVLTSLATMRGRAAAATTPAKRAAYLASADALVTRALRAAERYLVDDRGAEFLPPARLRSGDAVDVRGGRVAIPRDSESTLAGASILIPPDIFQTPIVVTLSVSASFVGGRDAAAWPSSLAVQPNGLALALPATVTIPFQPDATRSPQDLALFSAGPPVAPNFPVQTKPNLTLSADVSTFSKFQAGYAAPPPGQPGGAYRVQMLVVETALDATNSDRSGLRVGIIQETMTFRGDHTAATSIPGFTTVTRTFTKAGAPHHDDDAQAPFLSPVDFTWTTVGEGRFAFTFPFAAGIQAQAQGVASDEGRVISFVGRAASFDFFGVGVKGGENGGVADLAGRWAAVELGVQFLDDGVEPFTTRYFDAFRSFTADDAGAVTFDASGERFETDVTYHTNQLDPVHARAENALADSATETWTLSSVDGFLSGAQQKRFGWFDAEAGLLLTSYYDAPTRRVAMMIAVPQPATAETSALPGLYHAAEFEIGTSVGTPTARSSTHESTPWVGALDVTALDAATLSLEPTTRNVYTLSGDPPLASMTWAMSSAPLPLGATSTPIVLSLDASGSHRAPAETRWFAFSGDGRYVLGTTRGEATRLARGIALGVK